MRAVVEGCGRTGARVAAELARDGGFDVVVTDAVARKADSLAATLRGRVTAAAPNDDLTADVAVLCLPQRPHARALRAARARGSAVVSTSNDMEEVERLLDLSDSPPGRPVVVGAGFSPGLSCLLARHAGNLFDRVDEVHVCRSGTGGPACAREHHAALSRAALDWRRGWTRRRSGSGRQLAYFPEPVGPRDCYRAALPDALLLHRAFPEASRLTVRVAATRRDRITAPLPMLRPPHPDGGPGGARVEVWGQRGGAREVVIYGAVGSPAEISGTVAAVAARWVMDNRLPPGPQALAELIDPVPFLAELDRCGVQFSTFEGAS